MTLLLRLPVEILLSVMLKIGNFNDIIIFCYSNIFLKRVYTKHRRYLFTKLHNIDATLSYSLFCYIGRFEDKALSVLYLQNEIKRIPKRIMVEHILSNDHFYRHCSVKDIYKIARKIRMRSITLDKIINYYKKKNGGKQVVYKLRFVKLLCGITQNNLNGIYR